MRFTPLHPPLVSANYLPRTPRDLIAAPADLEMLNASFCGVDDITGEQAVELQDRSMVLHGKCKAVC